jgi:SAM-dependent methyltransferase
MTQHGRDVEELMREATIKRLNWGCGASGEPGWINSDQKAGPGIDISCDIRNGLPLESDSIDYIVSVHALHEVPYPDLVSVLQELHRVLKPKGVLRLSLYQFHLMESYIGLPALSLSKSTVIYGVARSNWYYLIWTKGFRLTCEMIGTTS